MLSMQTDVAYGICGAVVPIIIPYAQTYKDTNMTVHGYTFNIGVILSICAVLFSLVGTVLHVYDKAKKNKEFSGRWTTIVEDGARDLSMFLARAGDYDLGDTEEADRKAFKKFVVSYNELHKKQARAKFFGVSSASSEVG